MVSAGNLSIAASRRVSALGRNSLFMKGSSRPVAAVRRQLRFSSSNADTEEFSLKNRLGFLYVCFKLVSLLCFLFSQ